MSRHTNVRRMSREDYSNEIDEDQYGMSPASFSPTTAQYMYRRDDRPTSLSQMLDSKKGGLHQQQTHNYDQEEDDGELVQDIYDQIRRSGTINVFDWSRDEIDAAIRESNYQLDDTVTALLDLKAMSGGQVTKMSKAPPKASNSSKAKHVDEEYYDDGGEYYDDQDYDYDGDSTTKAVAKKSSNSSKSTSIKSAVAAPAPKSTATKLVMKPGKFTIPTKSGSASVAAVPATVAASGAHLSSVPPSSIVLDVLRDTPTSAALPVAVVASTFSGPSVASSTRPSGLMQAVNRAAHSAEQRMAAADSRTLLPPQSTAVGAFDFQTPSPDDVARAASAHKQFTGGSKDTDKSASLSVPAMPQIVPASPSNATSPSSSGASSPTAEVADEAVVTLSSAKLEAQRKLLLADAAAKDVKPHLNMVVCGHVDAGKSTMMGHMLYLLGNVSQRQMHKFQQESKQAGKSSFAYAWVLDAHDEERSRGITVDVAVNYFETPHRQITLLDAPGHKDFIPNMISGAAQADVAILVVDATPGGFDDGFTDGGQTKEHAVLIRSLGVSELVIAVNKMDSVGWSRDRFQAVQAQMTPFLLATGFKEKNITYCPVSGFTGDNLHLAPENAAAVWCGVDGVLTLLQCIDRFSPPERLLDRPLRMCVADVYRSQSLGVTVGGKIESGSVLVGEKVLLLPLGEVATVKALNVSTSSAKIGRAGDNVELGLIGLSDPSMLSAGQIVCSPDKPIPMITAFEAQILTLDIRIPIIAGAQVDVHAQMIDLPGRVASLLGTGKKDVNERKNPRQVTRNSVAVVTVKLDRAVGMELYSDIRSLGRFMLRRQGETVAVGVVTKMLG